MQATEFAVPLMITPDGAIYSKPQKDSPSREAISEIVIIKNRASHNVLDHHYSMKITAYDDDETHANHQWHRLSTRDGYVTYKNAASGKVLDHHRGESIDALDDTLHHPSRHWKEVDVGDGFVAIQNRATLKTLEHFNSDIIVARDDVVDNAHHQWQVRVV